MFALIVIGLILQSYSHYFGSYASKVEQMGKVYVIVDVVELAICVVTCCGCLSKIREYYTLFCCDISILLVVSASTYYLCKDNGPLDVAANAKTMMVGVACVDACVIVAQVAYECYAQCSDTQKKRFKECFFRAKPAAEPAATPAQPPTPLTANV